MLAPSVRTLVHAVLAAAASRPAGQAAHCSVGALSQQLIAEARRAESWGPQQAPAASGIAQASAIAAANAAAQDCPRTTRLLATFISLSNVIGRPGDPMMRTHHSSAPRPFPREMGLWSRADRMGSPGIGSCFGLWSLKTWIANKENRTLRARWTRSAG
jgi:hypothetical protein